MSCYIFTIITRGWVTILYNNRELTLHEGDLYTYSPGFEVTVLSSSSDYLSRVVRQVSGGRTVVDYINQMLLMEATFLLRQTSLSITQISDRLHFAEVTTFARFFTRMKGMTPREFRKGK